MNWMQNYISNKRSCNLELKVLNLLKWNLYFFKNTIIVPFCLLLLFQGVPYVLRWCSAGIQEPTIVSPVLRDVPLSHHCSVFRCFMFRRSWFYRKSSSPLFQWISRTSLQQLKISNKFACRSHTNHGTYRQFRRKRSFLQ